MSFKAYAFYAGQLHAEWDNSTTPMPKDLPDGTYLFYPYLEKWYLRQWCSLVPLNDCDVPPELKTLCLLLGINL